MYRLLGWINVVLFVIITSPYWLRILNKHLFHFKGKGWLQLQKTLRATHKPLGIAFVVITIAHGVLAMGSLRPHTGTLAAICLLATAILGAAFFKLRKPVLLKLHRAGALLLVALVLLHLIFPGALYYLFS